jgi:hypothetical protein
LTLTVSLLISLFVSVFIGSVGHDL